MDDISRRRSFEQWSRFIGAGSHILLSCPSLLFQQAANQPDDSMVSVAARARIYSGLSHRSWLQWLNKPQFQSPCLLTIPGRPGGQHSSAFSPDGKLILSCGGNEVHLFNSENGTNIWTIQLERDSKACAYSPDGNRIALVTYGRISIRDARSGAEIAVLDPGPRWIYCCAFSPDGKRLATGSEDAVIWDLDSGAEVRRFRGHTKGVFACAFAPDGNRLATSSLDSTLRIWDMEGVAELAVRWPNTGQLSACAWSSDGEWIACAGDAVTVWNPTRDTPAATLLGHTAGISSVAFSPESSLLASASWDRTIKVWEWASGSVAADLRGHASEVLDCAYSPDGERILSRAGDGSLKVWDARGEAGSTAPSAELSVNACAFSPVGTRVVGACADHTLAVWDVTTGTRIAVLPGHSAHIEACAYTRDGSQIVSAGYDPYALKIWNAESHAEVATLEGHRAPIKRFACSPDGTRVASTASDHSLLLWNTQSRSMLAVLEAHPERIELLEFSPDGRRLLSASPAAKRLWDAESGALVSDLLGGARAGSATGGFTADSKRVVSPVLGDVKIWDAGCGIELVAIQSDSSWVDCCAISPDGRRIVVASSDLSIMLCDAESGSLISEPVRIAHSIGQFEFSPDGSRVLAIARGNASLTLFDGADLEVIATLISSSSWVPHSAFSFDGKLIASGFGGVLIVWDAQSGAELTRFMIDGIFSAVYFGGSMGQLAALDLKGGFYLLRIQPPS